MLAEVSPGIPDGFRVDVDGNIWTSAGDGVHCITPGGDLIGKIPVPEKVANVCFGGPRGTASTSAAIRRSTRFMSTRGACKRLERWSELG